jgi:hypothetical protein
MPATTSTELTYTTVHEQFSVGQQVIGFWFLGAMVPIVFNVHNDRGGVQEVILTLGEPKHEYVPYSDFGVDIDECLKILTFNVRHFYKCYLPNDLKTNGQIGTPYKLNRCDLCDISLRDCKDDVISAMTRRQYRVNRFIYKADESLQNVNNDPMGLKVPKGAC